MGKIIFALLLSIGLQICAAAQNTPQLIVNVYDDVGVPQSTLARAEAAAEDVYRKSDITIVWNHCTPAPQGGCMVADDIPAFSMRIVAHSRDLPSQDFGVAFVGEDGVGQQADVFYPAIENFAGGSSATASLLGHVIAHELGHLLLGLGAHSTAGIMKGHWQAAELRRINAGQLLFDRRQSERIRGRLKSVYMPERIIAQR